MNNTTRWIVAGAVLFTSTTVLAGGTLYVHTDGNDSADGISPETALQTIQEAVNRCDSDGWTIYVAPGTYIETVEIGTGVGEDAQSGSSGSPNAIVGDITGMMTESSAGVVIIAGSDAGLDDDGGSGAGGGGNDVDEFDRGIYINGRSHWSFSNLTLQNQGQYNIYSFRASGVTINNCSFADATRYAVYLVGGVDVSISDSTFLRDGDQRSAVWMMPSWRSSGSGYYRFNQNTLVATGDRYTNSPYPAGRFRMDGRRRMFEHGIVIWSVGRADVEIEITNNVLSDYYLPIFAYSRGAFSDIVVSNNTISRCFYGQYAGGLSGAVVTMTNNIASETYRQPVALPADSTVENNLIYSWQGVVRGGIAGSAGIIDDQDPLFSNPVAGDFSLTSSSPAVDAGSETGIPSIDILGNRRTWDGDGDGVAATDIGAYEYGSIPATDQIRVVQWQSRPPVDHR